MRWMRFATTLVLILFATPALLTGQSRDDKVREDRENLKRDTHWFYDDLDRGFEVAARENKPLMVVLRCIP